VEWNKIIRQSRTKAENVEIPLWQEAAATRRICPSETRKMAIKYTKIIGGNQLGIENTWDEQARKVAGTITFTQIILRFAPP
jgi:hypothetical protein